MQQPSNHKTGTHQPKEPRESPPHDKAKSNSRSQRTGRLCDTPGLSDIESSASSPEVIPQRRARIARSVPKVQLPLSPAPSHSPPQGTPSRLRKTKDGGATSKAVDLSSDNSAAEVTHVKGIKRKRVIESDEESEPTAKKSKQETLAIETRRNAAKAISRPKTPPTSIGAVDPEALKARKARLLATRKRELEVQSAKADTVEETSGGQPETHSSPRISNNQTRASECEWSFEWDAEIPLPEIIAVAPILPSNDELNAPPTSLTRQRPVENFQDDPLPMGRIGPPNLVLKEAKVTSGYNV